MSSANDAAYALAERVSGSVEAFRVEATAEAQKLGLSDRYVFNDPAGLDGAESVGDGNQISVRDMAKVNRVFAELLSPQRTRRRQTVQAKFYLSAETYHRLRKEAAGRGVKQSALVEEALQSALA